MPIVLYYYALAYVILHIEKDTNMHKHPLFLCIVNACRTVTYYIICIKLTLSAEFVNC